MHCIFSRAGARKAEATGARLRALAEPGLQAFARAKDRKMSPFARSISIVKWLKAICRANGSEGNSSLLLILSQYPIKVIVKSSGPFGWYEKGLSSAIKKLGSKYGILTAPIEKSEAIKKTGISRVSWLYFCESNEL